MASKTSVWPVLNEYDQKHQYQVAMPIGGIGTGTVSLGGRGNLRDWELFNHPHKGFGPRNTFFALYTKPAGGEADCRVLEGVAQPPYHLNHSGVDERRVPLSMPRFRQCRFKGAYPLAQVLLSDEKCPVDVRLEAFNPMIPGDADASGIPVAVLRFVLRNRSSKAVTAAVCGNIQNFIGSGVQYTTPQDNQISFKKSTGKKTLQGLYLSSDGVDCRADEAGTIALTTTSKTGVTYRTNWVDQGYNGLRDLWEDFSRNGQLREPDSFHPEQQPVGSLAVRTRIEGRKETSITFMLSWHFPNRFSWNQAACDTGSRAAPGTIDYDEDGNAYIDDQVIRRVGNYYTRQYRDAWDVAVKTAPKLPELEDGTVSFVRAICDSDLPDVIKEAALSNSSIVRTQTCFRTPDGRLLGFEGCSPEHGCCLGSCTHVWNYEHTTAFLYGDLARTMREVEFLYATEENGLMNFRVWLPLEVGRGNKLAAADGQMGSIMRLYREWQMSGDDKWLKKLWPGARKAMEFCWIDGGWDADQDGVMEGVQHNTMDVEYFGPNGLTAFWYLGALRACELMARYLKEDDFADTCRRLFESGSTWIDKKLFNGKYYEQKIRPVPEDEKIADGLLHIVRTPDQPLFQVGKGCTSDQMVGQLMAHVCGLGYLADRKHVRTALKSIMEYNFRTDFYDHFNDCRTYALADESGLLNGAYPHGGRPKTPFRYWAEVWPGFEYSAAALMLYEHQTAGALKVTKAVRSRHDGWRRNPYDEVECGHHYVRSMAGWALLVAATGFRYSGVDGVLEFAASKKPVTWFWSNGRAWGTCRQKPTAKGITLQVTVLHGTLKVSRLVLRDYGCNDLGDTQSLRAGESISRTIVQE